MNDELIRLREENLLLRQAVQKLPGIIQQQEEQLRRQEKRLREQEILIQQLSDQIKQLKGRSSKNSSRPPSMDFKRNRPRSKSPGPSKGHKSHQRALIQEDGVEEQKTCHLDRCKHCGSKHLEVLQTLGPHQHIDWSTRGIRCVNLYRIRYRCQRCKKQLTAALPDFATRSPYGPGLRALLVNLCGQFQLSHRLCQSLLEDLYSFKISLGSICKILHDSLKKLRKPCEEVRAYLVRSLTPQYMDETSWRHAGGSACIWLLSDEKHSYYSIQLSRSRAARDEVLGPDFKGPLVTDRYSVYDDLQGAHQFCLAHLVRDFQHFAETRDLAAFLGRQLVEQLRQIFLLWHRYRSGEISRKQLRSRSQYRRSIIKDHLLMGWLQHKSEKFSRFCARLLARFDCLWTYLRVEGMEPTNNQAERDLRPLVMRRKKSGGTQSSLGQEFVACISTVVQTLRKSGRSIFSFLLRAFAGQEPTLVAS